MEINELRNALSKATKTDQMQLALGSLAGAGGTGVQMNAEAEAAVDTMVSRAGKRNSATSVPGPASLWM